MMRRTAARLALGWALGSILGGAALADVPDPRFIVELKADPDTGLDAAALRADIRTAAGKALPRLWRRVVPAGDLARAPKSGAIRLLRRAAPIPEGVRIEFDKARVRDALQKQGLGFIPEPPRWSVRLRLRSFRAEPMPALQARLEAALADALDALGILPDPGAPELSLRWQWLGPRQVALRVRGPAGDMAETRFLDAGDPLPELRRWMVEALTRARDAAAVWPQREAEAAMPVEPPLAAMAGPIGPDGALAGDPYASLSGAATDPYGAPAVAMPPLTLRLVVEGGMSLADQVMFEDALRHAPQVAAVIPQLLSVARSEYRVRLRRPGDAWMEGWLHAHGFAAAREAGGWRAERP